MCMTVCFKSAKISELIARSHSDDNHVNATAPCMSCTCMHFAQTFYLFIYFSIIYSANAWIHTIAIYANTWYISSYILVLARSLEDIGGDNVTGDVS